MKQIVFHYKPSNLIREVYDDTFFISNLEFQKKIFLNFYCFVMTNFLQNFYLKKVMNFN